MQNKKKLSPKQIFRTLAFHYHIDCEMPLELLADMVSLLYYPVNPQDEPRLKYKKLLLDFMKDYNCQEKTMNEEKFCKFMSDMNKHTNEEYLKKLTDRVFNRYRSKEDPDAIELEGFIRLAASLKLSEEEAKEYFLSVADLKNQITRDKFKDYMNSMLNR